MLVIRRSLALWPFLLLLLQQSSPAVAQVVTDNTLGADASQLRRQGNQITVEGGSDRAPVLFHSFDQFNIAEDQQVIFTNPQGIDAIVSRVTGDASSNLDGTLGVSGSADVFLLNPNGILFGPNAQLDMAGRFTASTADSIRVDDFDFSAVNPTPVPLLTLDVTPGIQLGPNAPDRLIQNNGFLRLGRGQALTFDAGTIDQSGHIRVPAGTVYLQGETLQLMGTVDTRAGGGQVGQLQVRSPANLTIRPSGPLTNQAISDALQTNEVVVESDRTLTLVGALTSDSPNPLTLSADHSVRLIPEGPNRNDVSILMGDVTVQSGGNVLIRNPVEVINQQTAPHLTLQAEGAIALRSNRFINPFILQITGEQGLLSIQGRNLTIESGAVLTVLEEREHGSDVGPDVGSTLGPAIGPDIDIAIAQNMTTTLSAIGTRADNGQTTGDIRIRAGQSVQVLADSFINSVPIFNALASTGNIHIQAGDTLLIQSSVVNTQAAGNAGDIQLSARHIILDGSTQQSLVAADTQVLSEGNAGNIALTASDSIELIGNQPGPFIVPDPQQLGIDAILEQTFGNTTIQATAFGSGSSGLIQVDTDRLRLIEGVLLVNASGLFGNVGASGDVRINARDIQMSGAAFLASGTVGNQNAGRLEIKSDRIHLDDGAVIAVSTAFGTGDAGELVIDTQELIVAGGSVIAANTEGGGNGGVLNIRAQAVIVEGTSPDGSVPSTLRTDVTEESMGRGGELRIHTNRLQVLNGGQIRASTRGPEDAGDINLVANRIEVRGASPSGIPSTIEAQATNPRNLPLSGAAGTLQVEAERFAISDRAQITTESVDGNGGNIILALDDVLVLRRQGQITATAGTEQAGGGDGGNISIDAGFIVAPGNENSDITANAFAGNGGNIDIQTNGLLLGIAFRDRPTELSDITASSEFGLAGTVIIEGISEELAPGPFQLPTGLVDAEDQLWAGCLLDEDASFVVTGRGGIPANPSEILNQALIWQDPRLLTTVPDMRMTASVRPMSIEAPEIAEAQGWHINEQGQTELVTELHSMISRMPLACH